MDIELATCIEQTLLRPDSTENDVRLTCMAAKDHQFAAVTVPPVWARFAVTAVANSPVRVCVPAGYPMGTHTASAKGLEARLALEEGAAEVTIVPNLAAFRTGYREIFRQDVAYVIKQCHLANPDALAKVLLYTDLLSPAELREVARMVQQNGGRFLMLATYSRRLITRTMVRGLMEALPEGVEVGVMGEYRSIEEVRPLLDLGVGRLATPYGVDLVGEAS
jgi:deoxyribose-phosphate aldolase